MSNGKILLIDDEPEIVDSFKRVLEGEGYNVDYAYSGEDGWNKYTSGYYDVVVVDWRLQGMNGMDLLKKIDDTHPFTQVIMITGFGDENTAINAHHYHAFDYMKKPVGIKELLDAIENAMTRRNGVISALESWVEKNPKDSSLPLKANLSHGKSRVWSAKDILEEIRCNTKKGQEEYRKIIQLTINLLEKGTLS